MSDHQSALVSTTPDTITLVESWHQDLRSDGADLKLTMTQKTSHPELGALPSLLDIDPEQITIDNVTSHREDVGCLVTGGVLSSVIGGVGLYAFSGGEPVSILGPLAGWLLFIAILCVVLRRPNYTARVSIRCDTSDEVYRITSRAGDIEHMNLSSTQWRYTIDAEQKGDWTELCIKKARERAQRIARALDVRIIGVHHYHEQFSLPNQHYSSAPRPETMGQIQAPARKSRGWGGGGGGGFVPVNVPMQSAERSGAEVVIQFRVEPLDCQENA